MGTTLATITSAITSINILGFIVFIVVILPGAPGPLRRHWPGSFALVCACIMEGACESTCLATGRLLSLSSPARKL